MTGRDSELLATRIELHLRKNNFEACRKIIDTAEKENGEKGVREITTITQLRISLTVVNHLEKAGYLYLRDLDNVDILSLSRSVHYLGEKDVAGLKAAVEAARRHNCLVKRERCEI